MARSKDNVVTKGASGAIGTEVVFRTINGETFMSKYPDMSEVIFSVKQVKNQERFTDAVKFATSIFHDPVKRNAYDLNGQISVYHAALKDYMELRRDENQDDITETALEKYLGSKNMTERRLKAVKYLIRIGHITNSIYQQFAKVSKPTATRDLQWLVKQGIIKSSAIKGAGASYVFIKPEE